jgi:hypothetical protein
MSAAQLAHIALHPSNVRITKVFLNNDRKKLIARKKAGTEKAKGKGKHQAPSGNKVD